MQELISVSEMEAIREVAVSGMQTEVSILTLTEVDNPNGDPQQVWAETETVMGWLWEVPDYPRGNEVGGVAGTAGAHRLYLPVGTDVEAGDRIGVDGDIFNVVDTNANDTYRPMLRVVLRRLE